MLEYQKETDRIHTIRLESKIIRAMWKSKEAGVEEKVLFEVRTHFVGNGSKIKIKIQDAAGRGIKTVKGRVYGDYFSGSAVVPKKAKDYLLFFAKLSAHGLESISGRLKVLPPRFIENARWDREEAGRGDIVKLMAEAKGFPDGAEVLISICEHDRDGAHDFMAKFPARVEAERIEAEWEYRYFADTDEIPTEEEMQKHGRHYNPPEYFFIASCGGIKAKSGLMEFKDWIDLEYLNAFDEPVENVRYKLFLPDGSERAGALGPDGRAHEERLPPGHIKVEYELP